MFVVPTSGGYALKLIAFGLARGYSWMPDAKSFVMSIDKGDGRRAVYRTDIATGHRIQLVSPPAAMPNMSLARGGDILPSVSPDGTRIAFVRGLPNISAMIVMPSAGGEAVRWGRRVFR
jgi:Tol biopolymer transport system component